MRASEMVGEWGLLLVGGRMGAATCFRLQAPDERGLQAKLKPERCFCRLVAPHREMIVLALYIQYCIMIVFANCYM